jgi:hypothetical protein
MKKSYPRHGRPALGLLLFMVALFLILFWGDSGLLRQGLVQAKITPDTIVSEPAVLNHTNPQVQAAMAVQNRHTPRLMALPDVLGTATGLTDTGLPAILVFAHKKVAPGVIPEDLDGVPVVVKVTGKIMAMPRKGGGGVNPKSRFPRPVPIGVSTGNEGECSAGTIGARVKDASGSVYALSANHVYALENQAPITPIPSNILQPGLYDTKCIFNPNNIIGTLYAFKEIDFTGDFENPNTIDAAIALSSTVNLGNSTPTNGYGTPASDPVDPVTELEIDMPVQKYGRTTSLTKGMVIGINSFAYVSYSSGIALFVNQIMVKGKSFIKAGDSGSLLVTNDSNANPVGLLFAGTGSGMYAFANPIQAVLDEFDVTIDGK